MLISAKKAEEISRMLIAKGFDAEARLLQTKITKYFYDVMLAVPTQDVFEPSYVDLEKMADRAWEVHKKEVIRPDQPSKDDFLKHVLAYPYTVNNELTSLLKNIEETCDRWWKMGAKNPETFKNFLLNKIFGHNLGEISRRINLLMVRWQDDGSLRDVYIHRTVITNIDTVVANLEEGVSSAVGLFAKANQLTETQDWRELQDQVNRISHASPNGFVPSKYINQSTYKYKLEAWRSLIICFKLAEMSSPWISSSLSEIENDEQQKWMDRHESSWKEEYRISTREYISTQVKARSNQASQSIGYTKNLLEGWQREHFARFREEGGRDGLSLEPSCAAYNVDISIATELLKKIFAGFEEVFTFEDILNTAQTCENDVKNFLGSLKI